MMLRVIPKPAERRRAAGCRPLLFWLGLAVSLSRPAAARGQHHSEELHALTGKVLLAERTPGFQKSSLPISGVPDGASLRVGDIDGDGKDDLFAPLPKAEKLWVSFSAGDRWREPILFPGLSAECRWFEGGDFSHAPTRRFDLNSRTKLLGTRPLDKAICVGELESARVSVSFYKALRAPNLPENLEDAIVLRFVDADGSLQLIARKAGNRISHWKLAAKSQSVEFLAESEFPPGLAFYGISETGGNLSWDLIAVGFGWGFVIERCPLFGERTVCHPWLHFPEQGGSSPHASLPLIFGDFNGDGRGDFLLVHGGIRGTWLGLSGAITGLEMEVPDLEVRGLDRQRILAGDVDGDGLDELLLPDPANSRMIVWRYRRGTPFPGVQISLDRERIVLTDAHGSFRFERVPPGGHTLRAAFSSGLVVERRLRALRDRDSIANIVTDSLDSPENHDGRALGLNGFTEGPAVCTGYLPSGGARGLKWSMLDSGDCPKGYAMFGSALFKDAPPLLAEFASTARKGVPLSASCCKLPDSNILTDEHLFAEDRCPDGTVATGIQAPPCAGCGFSLRCTKINTARYQLAGETFGVYWGVEVDMLTQDPRILKSQIPAAIRDGIGRTSFRNWHADGCVGMPFGSLLVSKAANRCSAVYFRQLLYRGAGGDPRGAAVKMFPDCPKVRDIFDPLAGCGHS